MARDGYRIIDSDLLMMELDELWARDLERPHRASPPRFFGGAGSEQLSMGPSECLTRRGWRPFAALD